MTKNDIIEILKTVYDPEIPILDIYTMGLVYEIAVDKDNVHIIMTLTTPACPMGDMIVEMIKNAITQKFPNANVNVDVVFEPKWTVDKIKDENIRQMFQN